MMSENEFLNMIIAEHNPKESSGKKVCPDCEGDPGRPMSNCCYAPIDTDILICSDCKEHAEVAVCETCDGKGVVDED